MFSSKLTQFPGSMCLVFPIVNILLKGYTQKNNVNRLGFEWNFQIIIEVTETSDTVSV